MDKKIVGISYSTGGYPSEEILQKIIPVYIKNIAGKGEVKKIVHISFE